MKCKRVRLLINPSARSGRGNRALAKLLSRAPAHWTVDACESKSAAHFDELVRAGLDGDAEVLALAGGDGTVAMALNASPHLNRIPWAILPTGSGNDFAKQLGLCAGADTFEAVASGSLQTVDAGVARFGACVRRYCCVASIGLDALALQMIHGSSLPRCKALNIISALRALWHYRPRRVRIEWEGGAFAGEMMFAAVTNTRSYGGGFMVSPQACLQDGLLDLCIVRRTGRLRLLTQFPRILRGTLGAMPEVIQAQTPWVRMSGIGEELPVALDGDLPEATTPLELRCEPASVNVVVPASWKPGM